MINVDAFFSFCNCIWLSVLLPTCTETLHQKKDRREEKLNNLQWCKNRFTPNFYMSTELSFFFFFQWLHLSERQCNFFPAMCSSASVFSFLCSSDSVFAGQKTTSEARIWKLLFLCHANHGSPGVERSVNSCAEAARAGMSGRLIRAAEKRLKRLSPLSKQPSCLRLNEG